jgi:hypothetical protein
MPPASFSRLAAALCSAALLAACQGADAPVPVARVVVSGVAGPTDSMTVGDTRALAVALSDAKGGTLTGRAVTWTSSDAAVATVDPSGVLTAVTPGRVTITATSEGHTGELAVAVRRKPVASLQVERAADTLWLGRTKTLHAQPRDASGGALGDRTIAWSVGDSNVASAATAADGSALLRGTALGTTQLVAVSEGARTTITLVVVPVPVAKLTLSAPDTVMLGRAATLRATATAPDGSTLTSADLAGRSVTWTSDRTAVITVAGVADAAGSSPSGLTALARGVGAGNATVSAAIDGASARYTMLAARAPVARLAFASGTAAVAVGGTTTVDVSTTDAEGFTVLEAPVAYTVTSGGSVVHATPLVRDDGTAALRLNGLAAGSATVVATVDGRTATLAVSVSVSAGGPELRVYPTAITAAPGALGRLTARLSEGGQTSTAIATWSSSNSAVMRVDAVTGHVAAVAAGTASIVATSATGLTARVPVTVTAAPTSAFRIEIVPVGDVPAAMVDAALRAASRWERVITSALPAAQLDLQANECDSGTSAVSRVTTGVVVYLLSKNIDGSGGTLAWAGPCATRDRAHGGLPAAGAMTVDAADVAMLTGSAGSLAMDVLTHELGHVLGIGIPGVWDSTPAGALVQGQDVSARFVGANASAAAVRIGATSSVAEGVPIEDLGGLGTAGGHWRERVFLGELMTGWVGTAPNPLSVVTVQALHDLGYGVTETGADIVSPASIAGGSALFSRSPLGGAAAAFRIGERILTPKFVVGSGVKRRIGPQDKL